MSPSTFSKNGRSAPAHTTWAESLRAAKARADFKARGKDGPLTNDSHTPAKTDRDHYASLHAWWAASLKIAEQREPRLRGTLPAMGFKNVVNNDLFVAAVKDRERSEPRVKDAVDYPDNSATNDDGWTVVKNKHGRQFAARTAPAAEKPEDQADETPEPSTPGGTPPPSPSSTDGVVELEYDGEDEDSGDEVSHEQEHDDDEADAEAALCVDATDEYYYDGFRADYDALVVEENKMMDQLVYDFVNRSKWPFCTRHKRECKRKGQRKKTVERRHQRSDKEALN